VAGIGKEEEVEETRCGFGGLSGGSGWVMEIGSEMGLDILLSLGSSVIGPKCNGGGWIKDEGDNGLGEKVVVGIGPKTEAGPRLKVLCWGKNYEEVLGPRLKVFNMDEKIKGSLAKNLS
jgi:hypothetical protein